MPFFKKNKKSDLRKDNMTTADKKQIVDKIVNGPLMHISKITWINKFYWDTKENDPKNKELLDYIERAKEKLKGGKK